MPSNPLAVATRGKHKAVLFDLDGPLVDTAPDMVGVLQALQRERDVEPLAYDLGRAHVSRGAMGLLRLAFPNQDVAANGALMREYLERYAERLCEKSALFAGLEPLLQRLEAASSPWGVVTNKPAYLTEPLLEELALTGRAGCIVSGDTLKQRKPDPEPLLHACDLLGVGPADALYVGDADRDIEAGRRAGLMTIAAAYGYITADDDPGRWGADAIARDTAELAQIVLKAVTLDA